MKNLTIDQLKENGTQYTSTSNGVRLFAIGSYYKWVWVAKTDKECKIIARQRTIDPICNKSVHEKFLFYAYNI